MTRTGAVGYLPQDPRTGDLDECARDRILSARGMDEFIRRLAGRGEADGHHGRRPAGQAMARYTRADAELHAAGGYSAESEAAQIARASGYRTGC